MSFETDFLTLNHIHKTGNYSAAQSKTAIWTPASGKRIILMGAYFSSDTATTAEVESGSRDIIPPTYVGVTGGSVIGFGEYPIWIGTDDEALTFSSSATGNCSVLLVGLEV